MIDRVNLKKKTIKFDKMTFIHFSSGKLYQMNMESTQPVHTLVTMIYNWNESMYIIAK